MENQAVILMLSVLAFAPSDPRVEVGAAPGAVAIAGFQTGPEASGVVSTLHIMVVGAHWEVPWGPS